MKIAVGCDPNAELLIYVVNYFHHLVQTDPVMLHLFRIQQHLIFPDIASQYGYLRYSARR